MLYTAIDAYRVDEEREINNHGSIRIVGENENEKQKESTKHNNFLDATSNNKVDPNFRDYNLVHRLVQKLE